MYRPPHTAYSSSGGGAGRARTDRVRAGAPEHDDVQQRVGAQAVGAVHRRARGLAGRQQPRHDRVLVAILWADHLPPRSPAVYTKPAAVLAAEPARTHGREQRVGCHGTHGAKRRRHGAPPSRQWCRRARACGRARLAAQVGRHAPHVVVHRGQHRDGLLRGRGQGQDPAAASRLHSADCPPPPCNSAARCLPAAAHCSSSPSTAPPAREKRSTTDARVPGGPGDCTLQQPGRAPPWETGATRLGDVDASENGGRLGDTRQALGEHLGRQVVEVQVHVVLVRADAAALADLHRHAARHDIARRQVLGRGRIPAPHARPALDCCQRRRARQAAPAAAAQPP